jgi:hypothetical protein
MQTRQHILSGRQVSIVFVADPRINEQASECNVNSSVALLYDPHFIVATVRTHADFGSRASFCINKQVSSTPEEDSGPKANIPSTISHADLPGLITTRHVVRVIRGGGRWQGSRRFHRSTRRRRPTLSASAVRGRSARRQPAERRWGWRRSLQSGRSLLRRSWWRPGRPMRRSDWAKFQPAWKNRGRGRRRRNSRRRRSIRGRRSWRSVRRC